MKKISLDTGPINIYLSKERQKSTENLFQSIKNQEVKAFIVSPVLAEVYKHLCIIQGKNYAESVILSFLDGFPIRVVYPDVNLAIKAGELKCRFRNKLSYVDSFVIALALVYSYEMHTTEKELPPIHKLKVITYDFQKG